MASPSMSTMYAEEQQPFGFTRKLRQSLTASQSRLTAWVEEQKAEADAAAAVQQAEMAERQARIDQGVTELLALQMEQGLRVEGAPRHELQEKRDEEEKELEKLRKASLERNERMEELRNEHARCEAAARNAQKLKKRATEVTTIDDLTRGIVNYKYLGLDFEKAGEDDTLRFCFTSLDSKDPSRKFWFELEAADEGMSVSDCEPPLDLQVVDRLVADLNQTEDMLDLVQGMRRAFLQTLEDNEMKTYLSPTIRK